MAAMSRVVVVARRMKKSVKRIVGHLASHETRYELGVAFEAGRSAWSIQQCDVCAGCKPELALGHYQVAWLDSEADDCLLGSDWRPVGAHYGDWCGGSDAGLDQPDVFAVLAFLNRGFRDHHSALFHAAAQADNDAIRPT